MGVGRRAATGAPPGGKPPGPGPPGPPPPAGPSAASPLPADLLDPGAELALGGRDGRLQPALLHPEVFRVGGDLVPGQADPLRRALEGALAGVDAELEHGPLVL